MDVGEAIRSQRAIRRFADRPIAGEVLEEILDAARRAPSSMNEQRWAFVLVTGPERLRALASVGEYADHLAGAAAAVALVVPEADEDWRRESIAFDLGQCAQNLMLAAWERGIGAATTSSGSGIRPGLRRDRVVGVAWISSSIGIAGGSVAIRR